ncbi:hypothetical protein THAOC_08264 [Thalassiosira oceanica]|uniref:Uncharacterized protein n=1 Tax=Thalassiosira oceanica TaxID=159749 RepID=K0TIL0_THAOC|nr:hypothetical protein THAOC_08264 [Thalassiosira oceanica]|eukprot:EJK70382.1 hypothetical protein THAOC_08264 [Thalassiosira oceanica]
MKIHFAVATAAALLSSANADVSPLADFAVDVSLLSPRRPSAAGDTRLPFPFALPPPAADAARMTTALRHAKEKAWRTAAEPEDKLGAVSAADPRGTAMPTGPSRGLGTRPGVTGPVATSITAEESARTTDPVGPAASATSARGRSSNSSTRPAASPTSPKRRTSSTTSALTKRMVFCPGDFFGPGEGGPEGSWGEEDLFLSGDERGGRWK